MSRITKNEAHEPRRSARLVVLGFGVMVAGTLAGLIALLVYLT